MKKKKRSPFNLKKNICAIIFLQIFITLFITKIFFVCTNSLENNGMWNVSKLDLEKNIMGSYDFFTKTQALENNQLNLGTWHGFQEVIYKNKVDPLEISFEFFLSEDSYLHFIFNKNQDFFSTLRFSTHSDFDNIYAKSLEGGEFIKTELLNFSSLRNNDWNEARLIFNPKESMISIFLNDQNPIVVRDNLAKEQNIGFRGSLKKVLVDNIIIIQNDNKGFIKEDFSNYKNWHIGVLIGLIILCLLNFITFLLFRLFNKKIDFSHIIFIYIILISILIAICMFLNLIFFKGYFKLNLPWNNLSKKEEQEIVQIGEDGINEEVLNSYSITNKEDFYRILFIGTSQTWGAGAKKEDQVLTRVIERELNGDYLSKFIADSSSQKKILGKSTIYRGNDVFSNVSNINQDFEFQIINTGIGGSNSSRLLSYYKDYWIKLNSKIVIINLSNNDYDSGELTFKKNLNEFVEINREEGIKTIFVLEANSMESVPFDLHLHSAMKDVAEKKGIQVIDMHNYLKTQNDKGIIWWDEVHVTSFGQKLMAEYIIENIEEDLFLLGESQ